MSIFKVRSEDEFLDLLIRHQVVPECFDGDEEMEALYLSIVDELFETGETNIHGDTYILID